LTLFFSYFRLRWLAACVEVPGSSRVALSTGPTAQQVWLSGNDIQDPTTWDAAPFCTLKRLPVHGDSSTVSAWPPMYHKPIPAGNSFSHRVPESRTSPGHTHALISPLYYTTHHSCAPRLHPLHPTTRSTSPSLVRSPREFELSLNTDPTISFWKIPRNPTFSVPSKPQSPTLLGSNLGTNPYVPRPL